MTNSIETLWNYLLDTETTSEIAFIEGIRKNAELFTHRYLNEWKILVDRHLFQLTGNSGNLLGADELNSDDEDLNRSSSANSSSDDDEQATKPATIESNDQNFHATTKSIKIYVDFVRRSQRILRLINYMTKNDSSYFSLYNNALSKFVRSDQTKIVQLTLQQILTDVFETNESCQNLLQILTTIPTSFLRTTIEKCSTIEKENVEEKRNFLSENLDLIYPFCGQYVDARREFRDTSHYFIDGDSLLLSMTHYVNIDLTIFNGHTLHLIYLLERFLQTLFDQSHYSNLTLIFFDQHHRMYENEHSILTLLRQTFIAHFNRNIKHLGRIQIQQFPSCFHESYKTFFLNEKPMFILYHDLSNIDQRQEKQLLSLNTQTNLRILYCLFANYHQYILQCNLYLTNNILLTTSTLKCFKMQYQRICPYENLIELIDMTHNETNIGSIQRSIQTDVDHDDVRLVLYLTTISDFDDQLMNIFSPFLILHVTLLVRLALVDRHLTESLRSFQFSSKLNELIVRFQKSLANNLSSHSFSTRSWSKIADLFDGRLFIFTLERLFFSKSSFHLDPNTVELVRSCLSILNVSYTANLFQDRLNTLIQSNDIVCLCEPTKLSINNNKSKKRVIQISNPLIETYLKPVYTANKKFAIFNLVQPTTQQIILSNDKIIHREFEQVGEDINRIVENDLKANTSNNPRYRTKFQQKLYEYFSLYGRSLTTNDLRDNQFQIYLPEQQTNEAASSSTKTKKGRTHDKQPNKTRVTKAQSIIEQNVKKKENERADEEATRLNYIETRLKQIPPNDHSKAIQLLDESLVNLQTPKIRLEVVQRKFDVQQKYLYELRKMTSRTREEQSNLDFAEIGFFATLTEISYLENDVDQFTTRRRLMEKLINRSPLEKEDWYRFQIEKINSRLPRRIQGVRDSRVANFIPDPWQVEFLNAVDERKSIIIVAPTASGKTYASYYAMDRVSKDNSKNGICVYVAPTKALINQVVGTIQTKVGPIFGIFTPDYRFNVDLCRVLVTTPACLEMLLFSSKYQQWCQRIQYCIFDEIHCMSDDKNSDAWERIMLLITCPMIGLSATVNNGEEIKQWIENVERKRAELFQLSSVRPVCLITHHERLADLNKYLYSNGEFQPLHPISLVNGQQLMHRDLPKDFSLSPTETYQLHQAMQQNQVGGSTTVSLTERFSPDWIIERTHCNDYSRSVCNDFRQLTIEKDIEKLNLISKSLSSSTNHFSTYPEIKPISTLIGEFVVTLKDKKLLPCIVFTDSRALCEELAEGLTQYFEQLEVQLRRTKYRSQIEAIKERLNLIDKAKKKVRVKKSGRTPSRRNEDEDGDNNEKPSELRQMEEEDQTQFRLSGYEEELLHGILEEGTLASRHGYDRDLVDRLIERATKGHSRLVRYLKRGVAYHHPQLKNRGRLSVEGLFRNRYVQILFSTWTLALGVHMPTRTVAFVKDSIYLDALQYRQSSGRAGRRGFDVQGNIVFIDIPLAKIRHLTMSSIPNIETALPFSVTTFLRILHFYSNAEIETDALRRSLVLLQCPLAVHLSVQHSLIDAQIRFHFLFTLNFFYRLNLINEQAGLVGLAGISTHLHQVEPANILLIYLMDTGLFHRISKNEDIVVLLSYLVSNRPWFENDCCSNQKSLFNSEVSLQPLHSSIVQRIESYNQIVKEIYGDYIEVLIEYLRLTMENQESNLPFSHVSFVQSSDYENGTFEYELHHHHSQQNMNPSISPFAATSGLTHQTFLHNFQGPMYGWDLAFPVDLSSRMIPLIDIEHRDHTNRKYHLNSFILDFYRHGSEQMLISDNELDRGETYSSLFDAQYLLTSVTKSLEIILKQPTNSATFFRLLSNKFKEIESKFSLNSYRAFVQYQTATAEQ